MFAALPYHTALFAPSALHTVMTRVISSRPARCLTNRFTALGAHVDLGAIPDYPMAYDAGKALKMATKAAGESGYEPQWAGQGAPLARALAVVELMVQLRREVQLALASWRSG